jgi:hypothetical protein
MMVEPTQTDSLPCEVGDLGVTEGACDAWLVTHLVNGIRKCPCIAGRNKPSVWTDECGTVAYRTGNHWNTVGKTFDDFEWVARCRRWCITYGIHCCVRMRNDCMGSGWWNVTEPDAT